MKLPFALMCALALLLFGTTLMYWNMKPDVNFLLTKQNLVSYLPWRLAFYIHIAGGMVAIITGPPQFISRLRQRRPRLHRSLGKMYVAAILLIAAPTGMYMAFYANGGWPAALGFAGMSLLWFYTSAMGVISIRQGRVEAHRQWMRRSYALTFAAVTLRLWVPLLSLYTPMSALNVVIVTAWISWLGNLLVVELCMNKNFLKINKHENLPA